MKIGLKNNNIIIVMLLAFSLIFKSYLLFGILFCGVSLFLYGRVLKISKTGICISLFSILYFFIYLANYGYNTSACLSCLLIALFFIVGQQLAFAEYEKRKILFAIVFAFAVHTLILFFFGIRTSTIVVGSNEVRAYYDAFMGMNLNATGIEAYYIPVVGALYYLIKFMPKIKIFVYLLMILILASIFMIGGRGAILTILLSLSICGLIDYFYFTEKGEKPSKFLKIVLSILAVIMLLYILYSTNMFGIRDKIDSSFLMYRFQYMSTNQNSIFASEERVSQNLVVFENWGELWLKGGKSTGLEFIHNTLLSMVNATGAFPALLYLLFIVFTVVNAVRNIKNKRDTDDLLCLGIIVSSFLFMMFEPAFESVPWLLMIVSLISGIQMPIRNEDYEYGENV